MGQAVTGLALAGLLLGGGLLSAGVAAAGEEEAVAFVREHHPQLVFVLEQLRTQSPGEFAKAVRELERSRTRLERIRENRPNAYEDELAWWSVNSRVRLMAARLTQLRIEAERQAERADGVPPVEDRTAKVEAALRKLIEERLDLEASRLRRQEDVLSDQLKRVRLRATRIEKKRDDLVATEFKRIEASSQRAARKRAQADRPKSGPPANPEDSAAESTPKPVEAS